MTPATPPALRPGLGLSPPQASRRPELPSGHRPQHGRAETCPPGRGLLPSRLRAGSSGRGLEGAGEVRTEVLRWAFGDSIASLEISIRGVSVSEGGGLFQGGWKMGAHTSPAMPSVRGISQVPTWGGGEEGLWCSRGSEEEDPVNRWGPDPALFQATQLGNPFHGGCQRGPHHIYCPLSAQ